MCRHPDQTYKAATPLCTTRLLDKNKPSTPFKDYERAKSKVIFTQVKSFRVEKEIPSIDNAKLQEKVRNELM